jgi:group II intron reverse transcriptase/maturase
MSAIQGPPGRERSRGRGTGVNGSTWRREVSEMRDAETVLGIVHERGKQGLPLEDVYRLLYNPHLYMLAYGRLYRNKGAMTPGVTGETVDGMALEKIRLIIESIRHEQYRWTPVKRVYIQKKNGKKRPLGMPTWSDKLVQEVMRLILEAYYEPQFSNHSHGFRPNRGCHTALTAIMRPWTGTKWFIEGDIKGCFDNIDHQVLLSIIAEKIHDNRFLRLLSYMLKAGYVEDWRYNHTYSGTPQGGVISPILSNIYLDRLDKYVEKLIASYNKGKKRKASLAYKAITMRILNRKAKGIKVHELVKQRRTMTSKMPDDPDFRRLNYVRYADDFLIGVTGPKAEAQEIKEQIGQFLRENLKLEMSDEKTLITHAQTETARFLGYELKARTANDYIDHQGARAVNGCIDLKVPRDVIEANKAKRMAKGKPIHRAELMNLSDYTIVRRYQSEYQGLVNYYLMARNISALTVYRWVMETSLLKTLAHKHKTTVTRIAMKLKGTKDTPFGPYKVLRVIMHRGEGQKPLIAEFGGIPLRRQEVKELHDTSYRVWTQRSDPVTRLLKQRCEMCGRTNVELAGTETQKALHYIEAHHIHKLANLQKKGRRELPDWKKRMIAIQRKTLIVCLECHDNIHAGRPCRPRVVESDTDIDSGEPDTLKGVRPVRRGADGKGA